jgi:hypothetical protein
MIYLFIYFFVDNQSLKPNRSKNMTELQLNIWGTEQSHLQSQNHEQKGIIHYQSNMQQQNQHDNKEIKQG